MQNSKQIKKELHTLSLQTEDTIEIHEIDDGSQEDYILSILKKIAR